MGLLFTDENTRIKNLSFSYANHIVVIFFLADKMTDFLVSGEPFLLHVLATAASLQRVLFFHAEW